MSSEIKSVFMNHTNFKVGDILMSKSCGSFEVVAHKNTKNITIKFLATGNVYVRRKDAILKGQVADNGVAGEWVDKRKAARAAKAAEKKVSFDVFISSWNPTTHNKSVFRLPYFSHCHKKGCVYRGFTYVDEYTYVFASKIKWAKGKYIATALIGDNCERLDIQKPKGITKMLYLHAWVKAMPSGNKDLMTDHANGVKLDNRPSNLRIATASQNNANRRSTSESGYRGVELRGPSTKGNVTKVAAARVRIPNTGKLKRLGKFYTIEEAAKAVDIWNIQNYGEFARLNLKRSIYEEMGLLEPKPKKYRLP